MNGTKGTSDDDNDAMEARIRSVLREAEQSSDYVAQDDSLRAFVEQTVESHPKLLLRILLEVLEVEKLEEGNQADGEFGELRRRLLQLFQKERFTASDVGYVTPPSASHAVQV